MREMWKDIPGYKGHYQVSDLGDVRSLDRVVLGAFGSEHLRYGRVLKCQTTPKGYLRVTLCVDNQKRTYLVHRLVLLAFVGSCPNGMETLHGSKGVTDNGIRNLKYGTRSENGLDRYRDRTLSTARQIKRSDGMTFLSIRDAERQTGVDNSSIGRVCRKKQKTAGGFTWEYTK